MRNIVRLPTKENRVGLSTFQKAVTSRFILAFALSSLPLSPSFTTSHHQRFSVLKIILLSSFPLPEPLIADVPNHPLSIWPLSQYNRIHSSWGVASLPRLMYPPWMVPTSLMKYVLFLSAHLDRPVSSLEQNGKTGRQYNIGHGRVCRGSVGWREAVLSLFPSICPPGSSVIPKRTTTRYSDCSSTWFTSASTTRMGTQLGIKKWTTANSSSVVTALPKYWKYRRGNKYPSIQTTIKSSVNKTAFLL